MNTDLNRGIELDPERFHRVAPAKVLVANGVPVAPGAEVLMKGVPGGPPTATGTAVAKLRAENPNPTLTDFGTATMMDDIMERAGKVEPQRVSVVKSKQEEARAKAKESAATWDAILDHCRGMKYGDTYRIPVPADAKSRQFQSQLSNLLRVGKKEFRWVKWSIMRPEAGWLLVKHCGPWDVEPTAGQPEPVKPSGEPAPVVKECLSIEERRALMAGPPRPPLDVDAAAAARPFRSPRTYKKAAPAVEKPLPPPLPRVGRPPKTVFTSEGALDSRVVSLKGGGSFSLTANFNFFSLSQDDRRMLRDIADIIDRFEGKIL